LKEFGNALAGYDNMSGQGLPPALWTPDPATLTRTIDGIAVQQPNNDPRNEAPQSEFPYGWQEILWSYVYSEPVGTPASFPVQRNLDGHRWQKYMLCAAVGDSGIQSGHYRVYLPAWSASTFHMERDKNNNLVATANPRAAASLEQIRMRMPIIGDANEMSERGDGLGTDDCSYIDAGEANYAGSNGRTNGNRFSDRHSGGTNYLFPDLHGSWDTQLRQELARDYNLDGVNDVDVQP
jgi:prepilin-type processing-associated H-X9-DG protein